MAFCDACEGGLSKSKRRPGQALGLFGLRDTRCNGCHTQKKSTTSKGNGCLCIPVQNSERAIVCAKHADATFSSALTGFNVLNILTSPICRAIHYCDPPFFFPWFEADAALHGWIARMALPRGLFFDLKHDGCDEDATDEIPFHVLCTVLASHRHAQRGLC